MPSVPKSTTRGSGLQGYSSRKRLQLLERYVRQWQGVLGLSGFTFKVFVVDEMPEVEGMVDCDAMVTSDRTNLHAIMYVHERVFEGGEYPDEASLSALVVHELIHVTLHEQLLGYAQDLVNLSGLADEVKGHFIGLFEHGQERLVRMVENTVCLALRERAA